MKISIINASILLLLLLDFLQNSLAYQQKKDYYKVLGVSKDATPQQIKRAFHKLALQHHPDKHQETIDENYKEITEAYSVLSDPDKRKNYDSPVGHDFFSSSSFDFGSDFGFEDFFRGFKTGDSKPQTWQNLNVEIPVQVTLKDLYLGKTIKISYRRQTLCSSCHGTGSPDPDKLIPCNTCSGTGQIPHTRNFGGISVTTRTACSACKGKGKVFKHTCSSCQGSRVMVRDEILSITINKGARIGESIIKKGLGEEAPNYTPGDLLFILDMAPNQNFTCNGDNLRISVTIDLVQSLTGFDIHVIHLDDHIVPVSKKGITKPGHLMVIKGEGLPKNDGSYGDLEIEFSVKFPKVLTRSQREGLTKILG